MLFYEVSKRLRIKLQPIVRIIIKGNVKKNKSIKCFMSY